MLVDQESPSAWPQWVEESFAFKAGADPLGLQTITRDRIIPRLLPGLLAQSDRARYFSFYAFLLRRYGQQHRTPTNAALSRWLLARDFEFALAVRLCPRKCGSSPIGATRADAALRTGGDEVPRGESVESSMGGYGLNYASPMKTLGLVAGAGTMLGNEPIGVDVLRPDSRRGQRIAQAFETAVASTRYVADGHIDGSDPIPVDVLVEYAERACLCCLDELNDEREALRETLLGADQPALEAGAQLRREAFALFLDLLRIEPSLGESSNSVLRKAIWLAFENEAASDVRGASIARWAAVAAAHFGQLAIIRLWEVLLPALRIASAGGGLTNDEIRAVVSQNLTGDLALFGAMIPATAGVPTREMADAIVSVDTGQPMVQTIAGLAEAPGVAPALAVLLVLRRRLAATPGPSEWHEYAAIDGEWQPGLQRTLGLLDAHLESGPTVADSVSWLLDRFVIRPHERIAYSKLPDFTFRFRWELGRLYFYDHPFSWTGPGDIRARTLASLGRDLGYVIPTAAGHALTPGGARLITDVFGP